MIRFSTVLWIVTVVAVGYGMFQVKYEVMQLEDELGRLDRAVVEGREAIHVLNAEWSFLNQPARLDLLARRHLELMPIGTAQIGRLDTLPERPATPPAVVADAAPRSAPETRPASSAPGTRIANAKPSAP